MSAFGGGMADAEGLFNVAELSKAKTYRKNICSSSGRDSVDLAPLGSGGLLPQLFRLRLKYFGCVFVDQTWGQGKNVGLHVEAETWLFIGLES